MWLCLLASMDLILIAKCNLLSNDMNNSEKFRLGRKEEVAVINVIVIKKHK